MKQPVIEFKNFSYQYRVQAEPTLKNINLTIYKGEKVLIVGPSGSGKSTLANTLNGLIPFNTEGTIKGSLKILGRETQDLSIFELSQSVGTVLQDPDGQFIGLTVAEDIAFSLENQNILQEEMKERVQKAAEIVDLEEQLTLSPHALSGGQKQRTALAGVMIDNVDILLFDEPLASLDPATGKKTIELIEALHQASDQTIIMVEHRLEDVLHCPVDRIIVMNHGEILADMSPSELLASNLLKTTGIREPLYITALKYAGCNLSATSRITQLNALDQLDVQPYQAELEAFCHKALPIKSVDQGEPILEFKDVCFHYTKGKPLLESINFKIHSGEMVSIVGRNGAGKSTLTKLICGFYKPTSGNLLLEGKDMAGLSIKERSMHIGVVMQNPNQMISKAMIYDEVALGLRLQGMDEAVIKERVYETLKICGLYGMRNWPISALSYGQKKRVTIASILVVQPKLLILDEPTAGQDYQHYTELMSFLKQLHARGITIIMITHDMHLMLEYTSRTIVLSNGHILGDASPIEILMDQEVVDAAHLKETSLYTLAVKAKLQSPKAFIESFIITDEKERN